MVLSCRRELNFTILTENIKRPSPQSPSPLGDDFWVIFGLDFGAILGSNIHPKLITFLSYFLMTFWITFSWIFDICWSLVSWKSKVKSIAKRCFATLKNLEKPCILHWKWRVARDEFVSKKARTSTWQSKKTVRAPSEDNAISVLISKRFCIHFGTQNGSKIATKF